MHALFRGLLPEHFVVDCPDTADRGEQLSRLLERHAGEIAGIIVEPLVQGAGGMRFHDASVLQRLRAMADAHELLLIFDEIFTGFGRTGSMFACTPAGIVPDIITLSKALTGGTLPLAATVARDKVFEAFWSDDPAHALMHGPTYMGNALACAAANASLDLFEQEPRMGRSRIFRGVGERPRTVSGIARSQRRARHGGDWCGRACTHRRSRGLAGEVYGGGRIIRPFGSVVYLTPAFTIGEEELAKLTGAIVKVLEVVARM